MHPRHVEEARAAAAITTVLLPPHLYADEGPFTKWGDQILPDGRRVPGELFFDPSVQKVLREGGVLDLYLRRFKYPRTSHVPFSSSVGPDDRVLPDLAPFEGRLVVVTEKLDGENVTMYWDGLVHARALDGDPHLSQSRVRALTSTIAYQLPEGWRICAENLQATHAINAALSWDETLEWCELLALTPVPVLYDGPFDERVLRSLHVPVGTGGDEVEGWVVRVADAFEYRNARLSLAKYVRAGHAPEHARHWRRGPIIENELAPREKAT